MTKPKPKAIPIPEEEFPEALHILTPYPDFLLSAKALPLPTLETQRVYARHLYLALTVPGYGYREHPEVKRWKDCEVAVLFYMVSLCSEYWWRTGRDEMMQWVRKELQGIYAQGKKNKLKTRLGEEGDDEEPGGKNLTPPKLKYPRWWNSDEKHAQDRRMVEESSHDETGV